MIFTNKRNKVRSCIAILIVTLLLSQHTAFCESIYAQEEIINNLSKDYTGKIVKSVEQPINEYIKIILLANVEEEYVGYILVSTSEGENPTIIEYGYGEELPYTDLINSKGKFIYSTPLENYYIKKTENESENDIMYVEGFSKEVLPNMKNFTPKEGDFNSIGTHEALTDSYINHKLSFDPYYDLSWLVNKQHNELTINEIKNLLKANKKILFSGSAYDNQVEFAYSIIGYHSYNNHHFLAMYDSYMNLVRFISYEDISKYGGFQLQ